MPRKQKTVCTIDAETDPFKYGRVPKPFAWGFFDGDSYVEFWGDDCTEQLMEYLEDESDLILYAHNGGKFDFHYLLPYLDEDLMIINGRIAKATMFDGRIELRDSWLILPLPLAQHDKDVIDYAKFERPVRNKHKNEISRYLQKDCKSLHQWVTDFIAEFGSGLTLAGAAFKQLKATSYEVGNTFDVYDSCFRDFYYGGRVQCFDVGSFYGEMLYIDINSAYSHGMMHKHWYGAQHIEGTTLPDKGENGSWYAVIDAISYGALPFRGEDKKLYFPNDEKVRRYKVSGWEIISGLKTNTLKIQKVIQTFRPLFTSDFSEYVDKFFAMKQAATEAGDKTKRGFAKLFLNSCYGKFGQDGRKFEKFAIVDFGEIPEGEGWIPYSDTPTGQVIFSRPDPQDKFFNVAVAGSVTGFVRAYLWEALCKADTPLYCDTDSIICRGFDGNVGKGLGEWDIEARPVEAHIAQRKMYALRMPINSEFGPVNKTKVASKGVKLKFDQIKHGVITGENLTSKREAPAFSLKAYPSEVFTKDKKYSARFMKRETNFSEIAKNRLTNPA